VYVQVWKKYVERQPTRILQRELMDISHKVRKRMASFIGENDLTLSIIFTWK